MIVNGQYQTKIAIADRALQYGDGCFTTIAYRHGCLEFFDAHIQRLEKSCHRLHINFSAWSELTQSIKASIHDLASPVTELVIKVIISRGQGGRGYSPAGCDQPTYIITHHPYPEFYQQWQQSGIQLTVSPVLLAKQPLLAGIKHLNRLEQVLVKNALLTTQFDDALVCDADGAIVETSMANVFWQERAQWFTADLSHSGVEGVMRNQVIQLLQENQVEVQIVSKKLTELLSIEEMFICNTLMGIVPVSAIHLPDVDKRVEICGQQQTTLLQARISKVTEQQGLSIK